MNVQAEVSLYPLRTTRVGPAIGRFVDVARARGLTVAPGPMSSRLRGESGAVFSALDAAFSEVAEAGEVVLVLKVSNACPEEAE